MSTVAAGTDPYFRTVPIEDPTGIELGRGIDIVTDAPRQDCVDRSNTTTQTTGQDDIQFQSTELTSLFELNEALGVSASAKFGGTGASGSASASFSHSLEFQTFSLFYFVHSSLVSRGVGLRDVQLKPEYQKFLEIGTDDALQRFRSLCGDGYVGELVGGGEFQAIVKIDTASRKERDSISASMSASMSVGSGSASFQSSLEKISKTSSVHVYTYRRGGTGQAIAITPSDIAKQAADITSIVANGGAVPLRMGVFSYTTLLKDPNINFPNFALRDQHIQRLSELFDIFSQRRSEIDYIINNPNSFYLNNFDLPALAAEYKALGDSLDQVVKRAGTCVSAADECSIDDIVSPDVSVMPGRR